VRVASSNGVTLAVHDLGGEGPPFLIAHATGLCGRAYEPLAAVLAPHFHVHAIDFRGHGDSTIPDNGDFAWAGMGDDVLAVVDALGVDHIDAMGHSLGGASLLIAESARPGLLRSAFLFEPIVMTEQYLSERTNVMPDAARRRRDSFPSRAEALWRYSSRPPLSRLRADALAAYVQHGFADMPDGSVTLKCRPESEARTFECETKVSLERVGGLTVPTIVGIGGEEPTSTLFGEPLSHAMPNARLIRYPHLGHFGPLQDPDTIGADILDAAGVQATTSEVIESEP
jgi:pimeloyl-ACP methyl ester carboxylesterase